MEQIAEFIADPPPVPLSMKLPLAFTKRSPPTSSTASLKSASPV
jgi:hypothetical protein